MDLTKSYKDKTFTVADPDARLRVPGDLMQFQKDAAGNFLVIPNGTQVTVDDARVVLTGASASISFAHAVWQEGGQPRDGWTSTRNFKGQFVNETLGAVAPAPGANKFGPNAAWSGGAFIGQRTLVDIVDVGLEIERISLDTLQPYMEMVAAAAAGGVQVALNSGFRSFPEQKLLHEGWVKRLPGFNPAAPAGTSKHQNGIAFDIRVAGGEGNPTYEWLKQNGPARGFIRTVNREPWHWEFDPEKAKKAVKGKTFKTSNVKV
jgi:hypothetical protein